MKILTGAGFACPLGKGVPAPFLIAFDSFVVLFEIFEVFFLFVFNLLLHESSGE